LSNTVRIVEIKEVVTHAGVASLLAMAGRRQFINLDATVDASAAHKEYGRCLSFKARVEWVSGDRSRSLASERVYWYANPGSSNKTGLTGDARAGFSAASDPPYRRGSPCNAAGWTEVVTFDLSRYGGDEFEVFATTQADYTGGLSAGNYVVWRKFWYMVTEMFTDASNTTKYEVPAPVTSAMEAGYRTVFIDFEEQLPRTTAPHTGFLADDAARRVVGQASTAFRVDNLVPFKAHIVTVDWSQTGTVDEDLAATMHADTEIVSPWKILWRHGAGTTPWKLSAEYRTTAAQWRCGRGAACPGHSSATHRCPDAAGSTFSCGATTCAGTHSSGAHSCDPDGAGSPRWQCGRTSPACPAQHRSRTDMCPSVAGAVWSCRAASCAGHSASSHVCGASAWTTLPDANISLVTHPTQRGFKQVQVDFSSGPVHPTAARGVEVRMRYRRAADSIALGWGGASHHLYLCTGALQDIRVAADWDPIQRSDCVHEFGHALGLVNYGWPGTDSESAWQDTANGRHCLRSATQCAMFYMSSTTRLTTFHLDSDGTGCHDHMRRADFSRTTMAVKWR
jgi:hypothetical protein